MDCVCYSILTTYKLHISVSIADYADSNTFVMAFLIFGVQQRHGTIVHCTRYKGNPDIQYGGLQTGNTYISACRRDRNAISRTNPHFWDTATQW